MRKSVLFGGLFCFGVFAALTLAATAADCDQAVVPGAIFYATDRQPATDDQIFTGERGLDKDGFAIISTGIVSSPISPATNLRCSSQAALYRAITKAFAPNAPQQILVYIHGYLTSFKKGVGDGLKIHDAINFSGPVIALSWPSKATSALSYLNDESNAEWSRFHFRVAMSAFQKAFPKAKIFFAAHSLGSRFASDGMLQLGLSGCTGCFGGAFFFAPDEDGDTFRVGARVLGYCKGPPPTAPLKAAPITLFVSNADKALRNSQRVHGHQRAGQAGSEMTICDGVDTIDVSYYRSSDKKYEHGYNTDAPILEQVKAALAGVPPTDPSRKLKQISRPQGVYYELHVAGQGE